jgi:hypothetical protein
MKLGKHIQKIDNNFYKWYCINNNGKYYVVMKRQITRNCYLKNIKYNKNNPKIWNNKNEK